jgi:acetylornithine/succinyldiaminopimelate/putrescine aminotransferase
MVGPISEYGPEAVEACLKFARRYWHTRQDAGRTDIIALEGSFHGRTYGSLSVTFDEHYRTPFAPLLPNFRFVPRNDVRRLREVDSAVTAAIILEPIKGEGGVHPLTPDFAQAVSEVCARIGALLIADEVQCGLGRTGWPFHFQTLGLQPHLVAVGKSLGAGVPMGAALVQEEVAQALSAGDHGSTFGGNLLACRAALFFLHELTAGGLVGHVSTVGAHLESQLQALAAKHQAIVEVRGAGLMWGLELNMDATAVLESAVRQGLLVNRTAGTVIRLLPPLTIAAAELDRGIALLDAALSEVLAQVA